MKKSIVLPLVALLCLAAFQPASSQETKSTTKTSPWKTFSMNLGVFFATTDSSVRLGTPSTGVDFDVENTLGLNDDNAAFRIDAFWRFTDNQRHRVDFGWFKIDRDGSTTLGQNITIDGTSFPAGTTVQSSFDFQIYDAAYSYSFFHDDRVDLAVSAGLYIAPISISVDSTGALTAHESQSITAPLPVIGLRADFAITPKWILRSHFDAFYLKIDDYEGYITDVGLALEYNAFKYVGFGLGFDSLNTSVETQQGTSVPGVDFDGSIDFRYAGLQAYMKFYID